MQRRAFLKSAGITTVLVAGGGVWRACNQGVFSTGSGPAYEPWENWRVDVGEGPLQLVRAAILAANPHNTQPWLFRLSESRIDVYADTRRRIGATDPYLREIYIGVGCALENLLLTAQANGYAYTLALTPDSAVPTHAARIELSRETAKASALYEAIPLRHTNRGPYDQTRRLSAETLLALEAVVRDEPEVKVFWHADEPSRRQVGELVIQATEAIIADHEQAHDSAQWYRFDWQELQRQRDGITLDALGSPSLLRAAAKMLPQLSPTQNDQFWLRSTRDVHVATAAAFGILAVRNPDDYAQRIRCGRVWQRMHLWATTQGLGMQPLNQMPERSAREQVLKLEPRFGRALAQLTGDSGWQALMVFRAGYPTSPALASPRRTVESVLKRNVEKGGT